MAGSGLSHRTFVNNDYVTIEPMYSTVHVQHELPAQSFVRFACIGFTWKKPRVVWGYVVLYMFCCCGCRVSQERINVSAVPTDPCICFQPLSHALPTVGSSDSVNVLRAAGVMKRISDNWW